MIEKIKTFCKVEKDSVEIEIHLMKGDSLGECLCQVTDISNNSVLLSKNINIKLGINYSFELDRGEYLFEILDRHNSCVFKENYNSIERVDSIVPFNDPLRRIEALKPLKGGTILKNDFPQEAYISFITENYVDLAELLIKSLRCFSNRKIML